MRKRAVANLAPSDDHVTAYDKAHFVVYLRLLDAERSKASHEEMCREILNRDPNRDAKAMRSLQSHLERARWMSQQGYKDLLSSS